MGLGYLTLAIKSEQDKYLTGNPSFTFFKSVYKRHTNFAIDYQFVNLVGDSSRSLGKKLYVEIPKNGDLLHRMYLSLDIETTSDDLKKITPLAYNLVEHIDLFLGGQRVDRHYGSWLHIWHELNETSDKQTALGEMISNHPIEASSKNRIYIPLRFWFNNNVGCALPLIALQYSDVKFEIKLANKDTVDRYAENATDPLEDTRDENMNISQIQLLCEFIHLDSEERRLFASNSHEYLITQLQTSLHNPVKLFKNEKRAAYEKINHKTQLRFNHPVTELVWTFQDSNGAIFKNKNDLFNYYNKGILSTNYWNNFKVGHEQMIGASLVLNGKEMTEELPASFYRNIQHFQFYNGCNLKNLNDNLYNENLSLTPAKQYIDYTKGSGIYKYSLCLTPGNPQPSGSLNFSNLETAELKYRLLRKTPFIETSVRVSSPYNVDDLDQGDAGYGNFNLQTNVTVFDGFISSGNSPNLSLGDRVLLKDQVNQSENGIYNVIQGDGGAGQLRLDMDNTFKESIKKSPVLITVKNTNFTNQSTQNNKTFIAYLKNGITTLPADIKIEEYSDASGTVANKFDLQSKVLTIYAVNYNILRIMSGMSSVLFSN